MSEPKVIVFGYDELLLASLDFISKTGTEISAVIFPSNRKDWRAEKVREMVRQKGYKTLEQPTRKNNSKFIEKLRKLNSDLILVWSYPMILPAEIIEIPKFGAINLHFGLLPEYRGVNGIRWALLNGETQTGLTLHYMDTGIDTGDIIAKHSFPITHKDDILTLMRKSLPVGLELLENNWQQIVNGKAIGKPQDESKAYYYSAKMSAIEDIDWSKSNVEIRNLIRASVIPFPGVGTKWDDKKLILRKAELSNSNFKSADFGEIINISVMGVEVATGNGDLLITKIEHKGKEIKPSRLIKLGLKKGDRFS